VAMLASLPGVNAGNAPALRRACRTLAGLAAMTLPQLSTHLGAGNAALLHNFLHARNAVSL